jgi:hypothetical protein
MARAGVIVHESIAVPGRHATEIGREVALAIGRDGVYQAAAVGPDTMQYVRSFRPQWSLVTAWITTFVLCGAGLVFFLVKKTESCTMSVVDGPTGAVVTLSGRLLPQHVAAVRAVLAGEIRTMPPVPADAVDHAIEVVLPDRDATTANPRDAFVAAALWLEFDDGRVVPLDGEVVVGRDPIGDPNATRIAVGADDVTVSKTHLAFRAADHGGFAVEDLHSTNGTRLIDLTGVELDLSGGASAAVAPGVTVVFGDRRVRVVDR